ncbi:MAG: tRNA (N(6)-L-threonylcarbamoyladenosine(37)-C(2))-methylthiotransferase [archaeon]
MLELYFETYGCTANKNSSEIMKGLIKQAGMNLTLNESFADLIIINSCIVKEPTQEKIRRRVFDLLKKGKKVILAGCMPRLNQKKLKHENLFLLDTSHVKNIVSLIQDIEQESYRQEKYLSKRNETKLNLPKISDEKFIGITQISEGCFGECTYCNVRRAKGILFSYLKEEILNSVKSDLAAGCKEIWLTSQDNAAYGNDFEKNSLPELLKEIIELKGNFFIRLGMMNPNNVLKILSELIEIYKEPKMFKFLHIPIQSGSDKILKAMKRKYVKKDILKIISEFKKQIPDITISTDIIVGFPGETDADFRETSDLIKEIRPEILNASKFWKLKGTPAEKLKQVNRKEVITRVSELMKLHLEICKETQKKYENWEGKVLVDQIGFGKTYLARNENYKLFAVYSNEKILGKSMKVKVKKIMPHYLICEVVK